MSTLQRFKLPIFIGLCVIAAAGIIYTVRYGVNAQHVKGAIGQRDVYRDGEVKSADVNATGSAPVATKALMETKEFKALEKNAAFQELMANPSFQALAKSSQFLSMLGNDAFLNMARNSLFVRYLQNPAMAELSQWMSLQNAASLHSLEMNQRLNASLSAANAQELIKNQMFQNLFKNDAFLSLITNSNVQALSNLMRMDAFSSLSQNSQFQQLLSQSAFQNAMMQGAAQSLSSQMSMGMRVQ